MRRWFLASVATMTVVLALVIGVAFSNHHTYSQRLAVAEQTAFDAAAAEKAAQEQLATVKAAASRAAANAAEKSASARAAAKAEAQAASKAAAKAAKAAKKKAAAQVRRAAKAAAKAAREKAAAKAAEQAAAAKAAAQATRERALARRHNLQGTITVADIDGALVTQIGGHPGEPLSDFDISGQRRMQSLHDALRAGKTFPCPGGSGAAYRDLFVGARVTVDDGDGKALATSSLVGGVLDTRGCSFSFSAEVPQAKFYAVTVMQRGTLTYSFEDMVTSGWQVRSTV